MNNGGIKYVLICYVLAGAIQWFPVAHASGVSIRALGEKPSTVVEQLPLDPPKHEVKTSLLSHLKEEKRTAPVPLPPPTMLPPESGFGTLPPLPSGTYVSEPHRPRSSVQRSSPSRSRTNPSSSKKPSGHQKPLQTIDPNTPDYKALFPSCIADLQNRASGHRSKLLRNDNRAFSLTWIDGRGGHIGTCFVDRPAQYE